MRGEADARKAFAQTLIYSCIFSNIECSMDHAVAFMEREALVARVKACSEFRVDEFGAGFLFQTFEVLQKNAQNYHDWLISCQAALCALLKQNSSPAINRKPQTLNPKP